jgi:hypothetical protein
LALLVVVVSSKNKLYSLVDFIRFLDLLHRSVFLQDQHRPFFHWPADQI